MPKAVKTITTPTVNRRTLGAGLLAIVAGTGITAGFAATVADYTIPPANGPDASLLAMAGRLEAARRGIGLIDTAPHPTDDEIDAAVTEMSAACWAIIDAPSAVTPDGVALKAAAAMHQLAAAYDHGRWEGDAEEAAWHVLSGLAGPVYVPADCPEQYVATSRPPRRA